ncbi:MAG TPA: hypothetical protein VI844_03355 [Coxiellaceae bacterium]|nr:hypothetical protein [Coxiellaceae bacterium]
MMKISRLLIAPLLVGGALSLTSCASIVDGTHQSVTVNTTPEGAHCALQNSKGSWSVNNTPETVEVHKSNGPMSVTCRLAGYPTRVKSFESYTKGMVAGNLVFGGLVGGGIDVADGAAFQYPSVFNVTMRKN